MIFRQLYDKESSTYTYLLADEDSKEGLIIDSVKENLERDLQVISELGIKLLYTIETHIHADHITATKQISERTGAKTVAPQAAAVPCADILIKDGDTLNFGKHQLRAIYTPGHTNTCTSYLVEDRVFTGDALFVRGAGRTDFQSGSASALYASIRNKLYNLPDTTLVYPGHDYKGRTVTSIGEEKLFNPRINIRTTEDDFVQTMSELKLANPQRIHEAVPANLKCGQESGRENTLAEQVYIDVRSQDEHLSGTIPGALCIPHEKIVDNLALIPKDREVVLFCRSGKRSAKALEELRKLGYTNVSEVEGGFAAWVESGKPVYKSRKSISIQRQVMITAGLLIVIGMSLGYFINPGFYALAAFVGLGLMFAGLSGFCGLALALEAMPWNQTKSANKALDGGCSGSCSV